MTEQTSSLSRQAVLLLLLLSCIAIGAKILLLEFMKIDLVPVSRDLTLAEAVGLILAGFTLGVMVLGVSKPVRLVFSAVLLIYSLSSLVQSVNIFGVSGLFSIKVGLLPLMPAAIATLAGICCALGLTRRTLILWRLFGSIAGAVGILAILQGLGVSSFPSILQIPADQASFTGALFAIAIGVIAWMLAGSIDRPAISLPYSAIGIGISGTLATVILMCVASIDRHEERLKAANGVLENLTHAIEQASENRMRVLQRMAERWALLSEYVGDEIYKTDARLLTQDKLGFLAYALIGVPGWRYAPVPSTGQWLEEQLDKPESSRWLREFRAGEEPGSWFFPSDDYPSRAFLVVRPPNNSKYILIGLVDLREFVQAETREAADELVMNVSRGGIPLTSIAGAIGAAGKRGEVYAESQAQLPGNGQPLIARALPRFDAIDNQLPVAIFFFGLMFTHQLMLSRSLSHIRHEQAKTLALSEQRFRSLYDHNPDAVFSLDADGRYRDINPATKQSLGVPNCELRGRHFTERINKETVPEEDLKEVFRAYTEAKRGYPRTDFSMSLRTSGHEVRHFDVTFLPILIQDRIDGVFAIAKDITKRVRTEEQQRIMQRSVEASSNAVVITNARDPGFPVVYVNPAFSQITGYGSEEVEGQSLGFLIGEGSEDDDIERIKAAVREHRSVSVTMRSYRKDGAPFWYQLFLSPVRDDEGEITHFVAVINDISEKKEQDEEMAYQATHDLLTGLANRSLFNDRLKHDFELAKRHSQSMAVLFIDLDEFKPINDTLGHRVGDKLLVSVAERLNSLIRPSDTLARFGGDEFVLLLPDLEETGLAEEIAERILQELAKPHQIDNNELHISASIGIATNSHSSTFPEKLLQRADMAMYKAKQQGRDTYEIYSADLDEALSTRVTLRNDLQEAIKGDQLRLHYQPLVNADGSIVSLEALVRWQHPQKGSISPADFIPIAEETGQIVPLGRWVTRKACEDALMLIERGLRMGCMAVNLSPMQFHRPNFLNVLRQILEETGLPPEYLELELTEGILMKDTGGAKNILNDLRGMGVKTAIDDFGTGFSSFGYLRELPVDKIKIDRSFVEDVTSCEKDAAVCKGVITLARELGMRVVAEGVETEEQYRYLAENGCTGFQGYYFAKPMAIGELIGWVEENAGA